MELGGKILLFIITGHVLGCDAITALVGNFTTLPCDVAPSDDDTSPYVIQWLRQELEIPVFMKIGKHPVTVTPHFKALEALLNLVAANANKQGRLSLQSNSANLRIMDLKLADTGWYQCRVLYLDERPVNVGSLAHLLVNERPVFRSTSPPSVIGRENEPIRLRCRVVGKPPPSVTWRKDGWLLVDGKDGFIIDGDVMEISSLTKSSRGRYTCDATNAYGEIRHTTTVYVKAPPEINVRPKDAIVKERQDAFFNCKASGYPSTITYRWFYNEFPPSQSPSIQNRYKEMADGTFIIYDVTKKDKGNVTCRPDNGYGSPPSASANLIVQYAAYVTSMPSVTYAGLSLPFSLRCNYDAVPDVTTVTWRKDGQVIMSQQNDRVYVDRNQLLRFTQVHFIDEGTYSCTPYNILGTGGESPHVTLVAKQPPTFKLRPPKNVEVEISTTLNMPCVGLGDPPPSVHWKKVGDDVRLPDERVTWSGGNVTISSVSKDDFGLWKCVVSNPVNEITSDVMIYVKYTTPHMVKNVTIFTSSSSAQIEWIPGYNGGYPQHFMIWYKKANLGDHTWSTFYPNGSLTVASVSRLDPDTVYQFAILPENVLGSGPFSRTQTKKTKKLKVRSPVTSSTNYVAPPSGLSYSLDDEGRVVLSWKPGHVKAEMLGYLVEYRIIDESEEDSRRRRRRDVWELFKSGKNSLNENFREKGNVITDERRVTVDERNSQKWKLLARVPSNVTSYTVDSLFRDTKYYFRVLALSHTAYSAPSGAVLIDTRGMTSYGLYSSSEIGAGAISGIVVGTIIVVMAVTAAALICQRTKRKTRDLQETSYLAESETQSFFTANKPGSDVKKHQSPRHDADSANLKVSFVKIPDDADDRSRDGVLRKIRIKLGRNKSFSGENKKSYISVKRTQSLSQGCHESKGVTPIRRSADGKFHIDHVTPNDLLLKGDSLRLGSANYSAHTVTPRKLRPVSDSFIPRELNRFKKAGIDEITEEDEEDGGEMEIDCSRSDIEVRFLQSGSATSSYRNLSPRRMKTGSSSSRIYRERPTSSCTLPYLSSSRKQITSFCETPPLHPPVSQFHYYHPAPPPHQDFPPAEYVYLKDLNLPNTVAPSSEFPGSRSFSPLNQFGHKMSPHNPTPADPPKDKYHQHSILPGGHYHLSPRGSVSVDPPVQEDPPTSKLSPLKRKSNEESPETTTKTRPSNFQSSNSNKRVTRYNSLPDFSSCSMPSLSLCQISDDRGVRMEKRSASEDLLTPCDEDSDRRCSFTSGSASTVRRLPSKESNLCSATKCSEPTKRDCLESTTSDVSDVVQHRPLEALAETSSGYESQNTSSDISPFAHRTLITDHDERYHPSSHHTLITDHDERYHPSSHHTLITDHDERYHPSSHHTLITDHDERYHPSSHHTLITDHDERYQPSSHHTLITNHDERYHPSSHHNAIHHNSGTRRSNASSSDSRTRRDNSSVDEKYEWDSEAAMEGEILEALKNFGNHKRNGPFSADLLKELFKLGVNPNTLNTKDDDLLNVDDSANSSLSEDSSQRKFLQVPTLNKHRESIEKRCAVLKEEYLEYQRRRQTARDCDTDSL